MGASQSDEQGQSREILEIEAEIESDPLLPRPLNAGDSIVEGLLSPLESTIAQMSVANEPVHDLNSISDHEEETQVWSRPEATTTPFWRSKSDQSSDLESTDEWVSPRVSSLEQTKTEDRPKLISQAEEVASTSAELLSTVERQLYQVTIVTPMLGGVKGIIFPLIIATFTFIVGTFDIFGSGALGATLSNPVMILIGSCCLLFSLWATRREVCSVNQAQLSCQLKLCGQSIKTTRIPLSELQEVSLFPITDMINDQDRSIKVIGKSGEFSFAAKLPQAESLYLFELIREKVLELQQGIFR